MSKKKTYDELREVALKYTSYTDFIEKEQSVRVIARKRGILKDICSHMERPRSENLTTEEIKEKALNCDKRGEFKKRYPTAYKAARRLGILEEICSHMEHFYVQWTDDALHEKALDYNTRGDFQKYNKAAYLASKRKGKNFLDYVCSHMEKPKISSPEKIILTEIQKYFPEAKKFFATKLQIPGKDYIKKLEVDILIKSLNKAIEFDGRYHHSLEGLTRGHPTWKEKHLKKYHEIKDEAFLSLGIEILHIKEEDWKNNRNKCISQIEEFLGITGFMSEYEQKAA